MVCFTFGGKLFSIKRVLSSHVPQGRPRTTAILNKTCAATPMPLTTILTGGDWTAQLVPLALGPHLITRWEPVSWHYASVIFKVGLHNNRHFIIVHLAPRVCNASADHHTRNTLNPFQISMRLTSLDVYCTLCTMATIANELLAVYYFKYFAFHSSIY